jgi:hypothetical protein
MRTDAGGRRFWTAAAYSLKGVPDLFVLALGRFYAVEVKTCRER